MLCESAPKIWHPRAVRESNPSAGPPDAPVAFLLHLGSRSVPRSSDSKADQTLAVIPRTSARSPPRWPKAKTAPCTRRAPSRGPSRSPSRPFCPASARHDSMKSRVRRLKPFIRFARSAPQSRARSSENSSRATCGCATSAATRPRKKTPSRSMGSPPAGGAAAKSIASMRSTTASTMASMSGKCRNRAPSVTPTSFARARAVKRRPPCTAMTRSAASAISALRTWVGLRCRCRVRVGSMTGRIHK